MSSDYVPREIYVDFDYMCIDDLSNGKVWADLTSSGQWFVWVTEWDLNEKIPVGVYSHGDAFLVMLAISDALM